ncbi:MAG: hypothetical protein ABI365_05760 [Lysobacteraceae bacterium]
MIDNISVNAMPAPAHLRRLVAAVFLIAGCSSIPRPQVAPPAVVIEAPAPPSNFTIAGGELDTWNAVGQILVRLDGVTYRGRAQKLGLYDVEYRGEKFLILTRALVLSSAIQTTTTEVRTALQNGKPDSSVPAIALLGLLHTRLPEELLRIATEKNDAQVNKKAAVKKKARKRSIRH